MSPRATAGSDRLSSGRSVTKLLLTVTEAGMLAYWLFATMVALGSISVPPQWMYSDYTNPLVVSWNWSFLPIDVLFAVTGLTSRFAPLSPVRRNVLSVISLSLMFCAGLMAVSFWAIERAFDPFWWGVNLWLIALSLAVMIGKLRA